MQIWTTLIIGLAAGLHAAMYGAYKDSPHESFLVRRTVRELVIATSVALSLALTGLSDGESPFIVYVATFALARIITEFWKLFLRVEAQGDYRIPTQIHWVRGVVHNPLIRLLMGIGFMASIYGIWALCTLIPDSTPRPIHGLLVGLAIGIAEGIGGGYKDGAVEGFYWHKFAKSPVFGALGGLIVSGHTDNTAFLLLAAFGTCRMLLELLFKIVVPGYAPGKFQSMTGSFTTWTEKRWQFLPPYVATWGLYLVLATHPGW